MEEKQVRSSRLRSARRLAALLFAATPFFLATVFGQEPPASGGQETRPKVSEASQACLDCHDPEAEGGPAVKLASLHRSPHKDKDCTDCHSSFTPEAPHTAEMKAEKVVCGNCHVDQDEKLSASVHGHESDQPSDKPTCKSCHVDTEDPHAIVPIDMRTRESRVRTCEQCHADRAKMARNGVDVDAVESYEASFHGKALLRFGKQDTAICVSCHTSHSVLPPSNPASTVNAANVQKTCGQAGCHVGATMNFANSGFSHLHVRMKDEPILAGTELFFKILTFGVLGLLLIGVALDMRMALFGPKPANLSRSVAVLIALSFASIVASIALAVLRNPAGFYATGVGVGLALASVVTHFATRRPSVADGHGGPMYPRFTVSQRVQHLTMIVSFTALVVTGMPIRYPQNDVLRAMYLAMGGMDVMRAVHRVAAVILIVLWIFHTLELIVRWKRAGFTFASWTMWPRKRDVTDVVATFKYHLGMSTTPPSFDRFQFREKFDYFAVYWGMPIMVFSGLILWFPVYAGGILPTQGIPLAYIAHADESVLAFLTIITWHIYNTHFKPSNFPMNPVFITGHLPEHVMAEEHGDQLARIKGENGATAEEPPVAVEVPDEPEPTDSSTDNDSTPEQQGPASEDSAE